LDWCTGYEDEDWKDGSGPSFAEAREKDLNDVRVPDNTMMNGLARGQCHMWVTSCKIDDKTTEMIRRALITPLRQIELVPINCAPETDAY